jgi:short-subunit dehydrogenase
MTKTHLGTALITGASSGIGSIYADRLAQRGYDLILVARNRDRLNSLADRITTQTHQVVEVLVADLCDKEALAQVETKLKNDASITMLVNDAGFGTHTQILSSDVDKMTQMINLNVTALMRLTYAAVPGFVSRGNGGIINISSIAAIAPELSQSLDHELANKGIRIQAVLPGATATEFWDIGGLPIENLDPNIVMSAEDMVDAALVGFDSGELITIPALNAIDEWKAYEAARNAMTSHLSSKVPAARYTAAK